MMKQMMCATALICAAPMAMANDYEPSMRGYLQKEVTTWINAPVLIEAIRAQNIRFKNMSPSDIDRLDKKWRAEIGSAQHPTIDGVISNAAADFLRARQAAAAGVISEIFVMDHLGLNVAASDTTSDYWQGDEAKFQQSFGVGRDAIHVGEVEFDESTQSYLGQISMSISDPDTGVLIGAITIGLNAEMLF
ncbi:MAG: hypothetical protein ACRBBU_12755 [Pseudooceanicola sp.]